MDHFAATATDPTNTTIFPSKWFLTMSNLVSTSRHFRRHYTCFLIKQATTLADTTRQMKAVFKKNIPTFKQNTTIQERGKIAGLRRQKGVALV